MSLIDPAEEYRSPFQDYIDECDREQEKLWKQARETGDKELLAECYLADACRVVVRMDARALMFGGAALTDADMIALTDRMVADGVDPHRVWASVPAALEAAEEALDEAKRRAGWIDVLDLPVVEEDGNWVKVQLPPE